MEGVKRAGSPVIPRHHMAFLILLCCECWSGRCFASWMRTRAPTWRPLHGCRRRWRKKHRREGGSSFRRKLPALSPAAGRSGGGERQREVLEGLGAPRGRLAQRNAGLRGGPGGASLALCLRFSSQSSFYMQVLEQVFDDVFHVLLLVWRPLPEQLSGVSALSRMRRVILRLREQAFQVLQLLGAAGRHRASDLQQPHCAGAPRPLCISWHRMIL